MCIEHTMQVLFKFMQLSHLHLLANNGTISHIR